MRRKLHIGGQVKVQGWEVLNAVPSPVVDHLGDARDLSRFEDNIFEDIYASHVLEHFDYFNVLDAVLKEWFRVLMPGGRLYVSVPDMDILTELFTLKDKLTMKERFHVMRMMFGGHVDQYDYHLVGLNQEFLVYYLVQAGFINLKRVAAFGLFSDTSNMIYKDVPISLNVIAEKPQSSITGD
jgi:predicted SAM-dependent methyltransferase